MSTEELEATQKLLHSIHTALTQAYYLEALRSEVDEENDPSSARLISSLKTARGVLRERLKRNPPSGDKGDGERR